MQPHKAPTLAGVAADEAQGAGAGAQRLGSHGALEAHIGLLLLSQAIGAICLPLSLHVLVPKDGWGCIDRCLFQTMVGTL